MTTRAARLEDAPFLGAEHALGKAIAVALHRRGDAGDVADVGADADDHRLGTA